jgi:hypothetical protein
MAEQQPNQTGVNVFDDDGEPAGETAGPQGRGAKFPCIRCKKNVGRNSVKCRTCQLWIHVECGGITKELFSILVNPAKFGANVSWNCDSCQASAVRLDARMNALENRFQEVENRVIRSEGVIQDTVKRMDSVEGRQTKVELALEQKRERRRRERAEEMREREMRRKNVVMHRVEEAGEEVRTIEERRNWDLRSCDNIFRVLNLDMSSENAVKFCRRVGEKGAGPRPLIVGLKREWQKEDLLEAAKNLRNTQFSETVIILDLTQEPPTSQLLELFCRRPCCHFNICSSFSALNAYLKIRLHDPLPRGGKQTCVPYLSCRSESSNISLVVIPTHRAW